VFVPWERSSSDNKSSIENEISEPTASTKLDKSSLWNEKTDQVLWRLASSYPSSDIDWDLIANNLNCDIEQCIIRYGYLHQQKLQEQIKERRRSQQQKRNSTTLSSQLSSESLLGGTMTESSQYGSSGYDRPSHLYSNFHTDIDHPSVTIPDKQYFLNVVARHNFEWMSIGRELDQNPFECRQIYLAFMRDEEKRNRGHLPKNHPEQYLLQGKEDYKMKSYEFEEDEFDDSNLLEDEAPNYLGFRAHSFSDIEFDKLLENMEFNNTSAAFLLEKPSPNKNYNPKHKNISDPSALRAIDEHSPTSSPSTDIDLTEATEEVTELFPSLDVDDSTLESAFRSAFRSPDQSPA